MSRRSPTNTACRHAHRHPSVSPVGTRSAELFGVGLEKRHVVGDTTRLRVLPGQRQRFGRHVDGGHLCTSESERHRGRTETTAHLKNTLVAPAVEVGEVRDVVLDEVLPLPNFPKYSFEPTVASECRRLHGRAFRYERTSSTETSSNPMDKTLP